MRHCRPLQLYTSPSCTRNVLSKHTWLLGLFGLLGSRLSAAQSHGVCVLIIGGLPKLSFRLECATNDLYSATAHHRLYRIQTGLELLQLEALPSTGVAAHVVLFYSKTARRWDKIVGCHIVVSYNGSFIPRFCLTTYFAVHVTAVRFAVVIEYNEFRR